MNATVERARELYSDHPRPFQAEVAADGGVTGAAPGLPADPLGFVWHYVRRKPWHFAGLLALVAGAATCAVAVQYGMKLLVDAMAAADGQGARAAAAAAVWAPLALFLGLIAAENALWRLGGWLGCRTIVSSGVDARLDLFRHLSGHSPGYFADHLAGSLGSRITATAGALGALGSTLTWNILPPCVDLLGALVLFVTVDWRMAGALVLFTALVASGLALFGARGRPLHQAYAERANAVGGELVDTAANIWAVKAFSARERERSRLAERFAAEAGAQIRSWLYLEKSRALHDVALWVMAGGMLAWAIHLWTLGRASPGEVVMISALTFRILHGSRDLVFALVGTAQHLAFIAETLRVIGRPYAVADRPGALPLVARHGGSGSPVEFRNVSSAYPDGRRVFEGLSLRIPAGQKVGIVGPSGAGKSTLVSLVQRLDDVQRGQVLVAGRDVAAVTQDSLRAAIAVVPQEVSLFHRSVMENIRYGRPEATEEEVIAAARVAQCHEFIQALPEGYDTFVGERGIKLSGGQRQRIGLARAILKDARILILDEATSALDTETEAAVQHALATLMPGRTVLAVAHRLSILAVFDRIVVLVRGRIVEEGSPAELRRRGGAFDALWRMQAEGLAPGPTMAAANAS